MAKEIHLPARLAIRFGLPGDAREPAAMHHEQRKFCLRMGELYILNIHLPDLEIAVRVALERRGALGEDDLAGGQAVERHLTAPDVEAADLADLDRLCPDRQR